MTNCESPDAGGRFVPGEGPVKQKLCRPFAVSGSVWLRMGEVAMGNELVLDGGARMRLRKPGPNDISDEQIETFYVTLAETCNVARSARAAGFSANWAYRKRRRDAGFRTGWAQAVREGYAKLELVLLERAMKGTPKPYVRRDGSERTIREYSTALAVALLRRHADTADEAGFEHDGDETRETRGRILEKLERMRARDAGQAAKAIETKGWVDRVALIEWGLRHSSGQALTQLSFAKSPASGEDCPRQSSGRPEDDRPDGPGTGEGKGR